MLKKVTNPFLQATIIAVMYLLGILIARILKAGGIDIEARWPWTLAIAFLLLFMMYNVIIGLLSQSIQRYWFYSFFSFAGLMFIQSFIAGKASGLSMDEAGTYRWIFFIFCPVYLFFIVMISLIKKIVAIAQREDHRFDDENKRPTR